MKIILACALVLGLAACNEIDKVTSGCSSLTDEPSCVANDKCHWNKNENACKS